MTHHFYFILLFILLGTVDSGARLGRWNATSVGSTAISNAQSEGRLGLGAEANNNPLAQLSTVTLLIQSVHEILKVSFERLFRFRFSYTNVTAAEVIVDKLSHRSYYGVCRVFDDARIPCCFRSTDHATPVCRPTSATSLSLLCSVRRPVSGTVFCCLVSWRVFCA